MPWRLARFCPTPCSNRSCLRPRWAHAHRPELSAGACGRSHGCGNLAAPPCSVHGHCELSGASSRRSGTKGDGTATLVPDAVLVRCSCDVRSAILLFSARHTGRCRPRRTMVTRPHRLTSTWRARPIRWRSTRARRAAATRPMSGLPASVSPVPKDPIFRQASVRETPSAAAPRCAGPT